MGLATEQMVGRPEKVKVLQGVGLAVAHANTGKILAKIERGGRTLTGRNDGQVTIPFETRKRDEPLDLNVAGALPELFDDSTFPGKQLYTADGLKPLSRHFFFDGERVIDYSLAVVIYDGPEGVAFEPYDWRESESLGWRSQDELLAHSNLRPLARHALGILRDGDVIARRRADYMDQTISTRPVIDVLEPGFVLSKFHAKREEFPDVEPYEMTIGAMYSLI